MLAFPRATLVHRYIARDLIQTFTLCMVTLLTLVLIGRGLQLRNQFLGLELSIKDAILLFSYLIPLFMLLVIPLSCMLSVFLTFLRMSTDRELIALKAGGVSLYQLLLAPLLFCLACALVNVFVSLYGISWGMNQFRSTILEIANTRARVVVQPGVFNQDIFGLTLFARQVDAQTGEMHQVIFEDRKQDKNNRVTILAPHGTITTDSEQGNLVFTLQNGSIYRADKEQVGILHFAEYTIRISLAEILSDMDLGDVRPKEMSWEDLGRMHLEKTAPNQRYQLKVAVELQKRWALPAACIVLGIFAMPLACAFEGVRRQLGVVLSLLMFLVYYSMLSIGLSVSESGKLPPVVGLWIPNAFFFIIGVVGMHLAVHEKTPSLGALVLRLPFLRTKSTQQQG